MDLKSQFNPIYQSLIREIELAETFMAVSAAHNALLRVRRMQKELQAEEDHLSDPIRKVSSVGGIPGHDSK